MIAQKHWAFGLGQPVFTNTEQNCRTLHEPDLPWICAFSVFFARFDVYWLAELCARSRANWLCPTAAALAQGSGVPCNFWIKGCSNLLFYYWLNVREKS